MEKKIEEIVQLLRQDKRKVERMELAVTVYYRFPSAAEWQGPLTALNIGGNGLSLILDKEVAKKSELELKIVLPQEPQRPIEVKGEVIWVQPADSRFHLGIRFFRMQENDRRRFVSYICDSILVTYSKDK